MKFSLYYHTLKHLKVKQIQYRLYYACRKRWRRITGFQYQLPKNVPEVRELQLAPSIVNHTSFYPENTFSFLNLQKQFGNHIDWNFKDYGKLWTYNLTYFEYLHQENMDAETGLQLIRNFIENINNIKDGLEPFPISLRLINWIKFLVQHKIQDAEIDRSIYFQTQMLLDQLEYHLLGNHLLENGFALLFLECYFSGGSRLPLAPKGESARLKGKEAQASPLGARGAQSKAEQILTPELKEQILPDGAHFELSPMYHQLMLYRILDCINLMKSNRTDDFSRRKGLEETTAKVVGTMLGWLKEITFKNGDIPMLNDSAHGIAPTSQQLFEYADRLGVSTKTMELKESGYRKFTGENYEAIVDVGNIGPDYIPGHAHADTLSFVVHAQGHPFVVDTGVLTYEANAQRLKDRSTAAHNTVQVAGRNQSEIWSSFRVAKRAYANIIKEDKNSITASHDGYKSMGIVHERSFEFGDKTILIKDNISNQKDRLAQAFIHLHPDVAARLENNTVVTNIGNITFAQSKKIELTDYDYAAGFNKQAKSVKIIITFTDCLETSINL